MRDIGIRITEEERGAGDGERERELLTGLSFFLQDVV